MANRDRETIVFSGTISIDQYQYMRKFTFSSVTLWPMIGTLISCSFLFIVCCLRSFVCVCVCVCVLPNDFPDLHFPLFELLPTIPTFMSNGLYIFGSILCSSSSSNGPAYHSDLQPIEIVWAWIKGSIGRQYKKGDGLNELEERLVHEFEKVCTMGTKVERIIEKAAALTHQMWIEANREDDGDNNGAQPQAAAAAQEGLQQQQQQQQQPLVPNLDDPMINNPLLAMIEPLENDDHVGFSTEPTYGGVDI